MGAWSWADENGDWLRNTLYLCERAGTISCGACPPFHQSSLEQSTLNGIELHFKHLVGTLGECFPIPALSLTDLQAACGSPVQAEGDPRSWRRIGRALVLCQTSRTLTALCALRQLCFWVIRTY